MTRPAYVLRAAAFLSGGAFAVHEGRYRLGFGAHADETLAAHGHTYLSAVTPVISLLIAAALGQLIWAVCQPARSSNGHGLPFARLAALCAAALLTVYVGQELVEGALAPGHPAGLDGVLGDGGWTSVPLAALCGTLAACGLRLGRAIDAAAPPATGLAARLRPTLMPHLSLVLRELPANRPRAPLDLLRAGRAPPQLASAVTFAS